MNHAPPMNDITKRAMEVIGKDDLDSDYILQPEGHAAGLPPEAGSLKRILMREEHTKIATRYSASDERARRAQSRYKRAGQRMLIATLIATLIGAIFLSPPAQTISPNWRASTTVFEYLLLVAALLTAFYLAVSRPFPKWMESRAHAELARIQLFNDVMDAQEASRDGELPLLPLKLEYFRRYQLEVQRRYYGTRGKEHERAAGHTKGWQYASLALSATAGLIAFWAILPLLPQIFAYFQIPLPSLLQNAVSFAAALPVEDDRWLLALGVGGSALYAFATSRTLMNLDERNASRYLTTRDNLDFLVEKKLQAARDYAAEGGEAQVRQFVDRVQNLISSEHREWVSLREVVGDRVV